MRYEDTYNRTNSASDICSLSLPKTKKTCAHVCVAGNPAVHVYISVTACNGRINLVPISGRMRVSRSRTCRNECQTGTRYLVPRRLSGIVLLHRCTPVSGDLGLNVRQFPKHVHVYLKWYPEQMGGCGAHVGLAGAV